MTDGVNVVGTEWHLGTARAESPSMILSGGVPGLDVDGGVAGAGVCPHWQCGFRCGHRGGGHTPCAALGIDLNRKRDQWVLTICRSNYCTRR